MSEKTLHLLIVDDEESIRIPLADHLQRTYRYDIETAGNGQEALTLIAKFQGRYDVALVDQVLEGGISGLDLLKEIKSRYSEIQVIVFTGWGMKQEEGIEILNQGAYRYIAKPFNMEELALTIRFAAEQRQIRREHEYLSGLVQVSKELTQTTDLEKQLAIVWNYVEGQLATPTFFIALYDSATDTLQFRQSYDEGEPDPLPDRYLGDDSTVWGVAGHVVKMKQEQTWLDREEAKKRWQDLKIKPHISGKGPSETGICLPLQVGKKTLGVLSVQSYQPLAFDQAFLNAVRTLGGQLAPAIENSRLFSELEKTTSHLEGLVEGSLDAAIFIDVNKHITVFNNQAEKMLGYSADEMRGHNVTALYSNINQASMIWDLINQQNKIVGHEVLLRHRDGTEIPILLSAVSVRDADGNNVGQAGFLRDMRQIHLLEDRLRALIRAGQAISGLLETDQILQLIVESAVAAFPATEKGSIHLFDEKTQRLYIKASYGYNPKVAEAATSRIGEGFAGWVYEHGVPIVSGNAQEDKRFKAYDYPEIRNQKSMICAPLIVKGKVIGTLSIDNLTTYDAFRPDDVELLSSFADQAANAIENSRLYKETHLREQLLTALDEASRHIRAEKEPAKLLHEVIRLASELMGCTAGGLFINYPHIKSLEMTATYGLPSDLIGARVSYEGPIGQVAQSGITRIISIYKDRSDQEAIFKDQDFKTVVVLPLMHVGEVEAVLFVVDTTGLRDFDRNDLEILERFVAQASIALHASQLMSKEQRRFSQMAILHRISDYIQGAMDLDKVLHVLLTGITAGYGLGFNRAALLLLDQAGKILTGRMGIGYLNASEAYEDWSYHHRYGLEDFGKYVQRLEERNLAGTPVGDRVYGLQLPIKLTDPDMFSRVTFERHWALATQEELNCLPADFVIAFEPALPFVVVPLMAREKVIGLLAADNKFNRSPITSEEVDLLLTFTNTAALAINNVQLYKEAETAREKIRASFEASNALVLHQSSKQLLEDVIKQMQLISGASWVSIVMVDAIGQITSYLTTNVDKKVDSSKMILDGITKQVVSSGMPVVIDDTRVISQSVISEILPSDAHAALCLPFSMRGKQIGLMWIYYNEPRIFLPYELEAIQLYANQAAIAYDSAHRMEELEHMRRAAEAVAGVLEPSQVLRQIVESAKEVLQADSSAIYSYDNVRDQFIPHEFVAYGISINELERLRKSEPIEGGTARTVMERGWIGVADISDPFYHSIESSTKDLLSSIGIKSFQGVALKISDEKLGVLYVNYNRPRNLTDEDRRILETFAYHATLALKKARLLEQVSKARDEAKVVAQVTVLGDREATLLSVVRGTQEAVGCDAVVLFVYDQATDQLEQPPVMAGVAYPNRASSYNEEALNSVIYQMLRLNGPYLVETITEDALFKDKRFLKEEGIESCAVIPMKVAEQKVGIMFVNYRSHHRFTADEQTNIELFANQAAVAIRNTQLYDELKRTQGLIGARTALAWVGMTSSAWRHTIEKHALTIKEQVELLRRDLAKTPENERVRQRLDMISRLSTQIQEKPITPPLSSEEASQSIPINALVEERTKRLWDHTPYNTVELELNLGVEDDDTVRGSPEWIRRAFDILIDNAVDAMSSQEKRRLVICTKSIGTQIEIVVSDNGPGIPENVLKSLFQAPIKKPEGAKGLGMGLLFAHTIIQTYRGEIRCESTGVHGTTMVVSFPKETIVNKLS